MQEKMHIMLSGGRRIQMMIRIRKSYVLSNMTKTGIVWELLL